jgi:hypothetical protein
MAFRNASIDGREMTLRVIFDGNEASSRSHHVGYAPESGSDSRDIGRRSHSWLGFAITK